MTTKRAFFLSTERLEDRRLFSQGGLDPSFCIGWVADKNVPARISAVWRLARGVAEDAEGRILVASSSGAGRGRGRHRFRGLDSNGSVDPTFTTFNYGGGVWARPFRRSNQILPMSNGNVLLLGFQIQELNSSAS